MLVVTDEWFMSIRVLRRSGYKNAENLILAAADSR